MKIGYLLLLYVSIIIVTVCVCIMAVYRNSYRPLDVVEMNSRYQQVLEELDSVNISPADSNSITPADSNSMDFTPAEISHLEEKYLCRIFLATDRNYESDVMEVIGKKEILYDYVREGMLIGKISFAGEGFGYDGLRSDLIRNTVWMAVVLLVVGIGMFLWIWFWYIHPFHTLQSFAREVSRGNLDLPLKQARRNYFGAFTESFDLMREELKQAREDEYRANISKKELVAGLSHDIKTPVATIRAACEVLQVKETNPDTLHKVKVIAGKAEMIDRLIGNMFQATLEELEVLRIQPTETASSEVTDMFLELKEYGKLRLVNEIPSCLIWADAMRLNQVIDNIVNNSYKYAGTEVTVSFSEQENGISIRIQDSGTGVTPEELPLLTGKFYRGDNTEGKAGSGLGLYLADHFMERMDGGMECYCDGGFIVDLFLRKI